MTYLVLGPDNPDADLIDLQYAECFARFGAGAVNRVDPEAIYRERGMTGLQEHVLDVVRRQGVRIIVYLLGTEFDFPPQFFSRNLRDTYRILILGDDEHYFDVSHRYYAQCFDLVLTTNPLCDRFRLLGIDARFLPTLYDKAVFKPNTSVIKDIDISFIGAMLGKAGRENYAKALRAAGLRVNLYGAGTPAGIISREEVIDVYRRS